MSFVRKESLNTDIDSRKHHYEVERDYARKIIASKKGSDERSRLYAEGYNTVRQITEQYDKGGGETDYTDVVLSIIGKLARRNASVFDLGCASGNLILGLLKKGYKAEGIDVSGKSIESAKKKLEGYGSGNCVKLADIADYAADKYYDVIVLDNVIEHIHPDSVPDTLVKCHKMLKEGGHILILTPHRFSGPHDISKYFLSVGAKAEGFHLREYSFSELEAELLGAGFDSVLGFPVHPRLFKRIGFVTSPSLSAAWKTRFFEKIFVKGYFRWVLSLNSTLSRLIVAVFSPAVCIGVKGSTEK